MLAGPPVILKGVPWWSSADLDTQIPRSVVLTFVRDLSWILPFYIVTDIASRNSGYECPSKHQ
jgi:hypothetical protein